MNNTARMLLEKRMMDKRRYGNDRRDYNDSRDRRDYNDSRDYNDGRTYHVSTDHNDMRMDRRDRNDYNDMRRDYDERRDRRDYNDNNDYGHNMYKLSKEDIHEWMKNLENEDGTRGAKFNISQMTSVAEKIGVRFDKFDEHEFCMVANMLYSDLGMDLRNCIPPEKEAMEYGKMAKSWLNDRDSSAKDSEKLALYYHLIVKK